MLLTILLGVISNATSISSKAMAQIEATRVARESLDMIGRDISPAAMPWARTNTKSLQFLVNSSSYFNSMFWQAPVASGSSNGTLAIVGYFVLRDLQAGAGDSRLQLRRVLIPPDSTNGDYTVYNASAAPWITASVLADFGPATASQDSQNALKGWVADGVLAMWVRCLDPFGNVIPGSYDSRAARYGAVQWTNSYPGGYPFSRLPAFVEVALVCASPRDVARISDLTVPNTVTNAADFSSGVSAYVDQVRAKNPGAASITSFTRKFRLYNSD